MNDLINLIEIVAILTSISIASYTLGKIRGREEAVKMLHELKDKENANEINC